MDEQIKSEIDGGLESIQDMFELCKVRGDQFYKVAIAAFEAGTIFEMYLLACSVLDDGENAELVEGLGSGITSLLGSLTQKVGEGMPSEEFKEAIIFGNKVHDQKLAMQSRLQNISNKKG